MQDVKNWTLINQYYLPGCCDIKNNRMKQTASQLEVNDNMTEISKEIGSKSSRQTDYLS